MTLSGTGNRGERKTSLKLIIVGTVALTAAAIASLCLYHNSQPQIGLEFYAQSSEKQTAFMQFLAKYGKTYATKSDMSSRFAVFSEHYDRVQAHNSASDGEKFQMGINQFSDMTIAEFSQLYDTQGLVAPTKKDQTTTRPVLRESKVALPERVDWHEAGVMSTPNDQGGCGSCWAFTTAATIEAAYAIKKNTSAIDKLSVQYLIDCDNVNFGCGGGWMLDAYDFTKTHGVVKESQYKSKYLGRKDACHDPADVTERIRNDDQKEEDSITVQRLKELVSMEPMGVAMHSNPKCLMGYHSGVVREEDCKCSNAQSATVNHAVTVVGYGKNTQNNQDECPEYWKIRNSWGPSWGEQGYFKLCIPKDEKKLPTGTCQVLSYVQYPLFN